MNKYLGAGLVFLILLCNLCFVTYASDNDDDSGWNSGFDSGSSCSPQCQSTFDYVIVGSGAAGGAAARVLLDAGYSIGVIEAGAYYDDRQDIWDATRSSNTFNARSPTYAWQHKSDVEVATGRSYQVNIAMALGGSTTHYGMQYVLGNKGVFDNWERLVGSYWSFNNVKQTYTQLENYNNEEPSNVPVGRGTNGPVGVRHPANGPTSGLGSMANKLATWSAAASGIPVNSDYNGPQSYGPFIRYDLFQNQSRNRVSSSTAFLNSVVNPDGSPIGNRKIRVFLESHVVKVLFKSNKKAYAVDAIRSGYTTRICARKEILLAANIRSAQILELSGVGNPSILSANGIPLVYNNTNVGEHLSNHPQIIVFFNSNPADGGITTPTDPQALYAGGAFYPPINPDGSFQATDPNQPRGYQTLWLNGGPGRVGLFSMLAQPKSFGKSHIQSSNPLQIPLTDEGGFSNPDDLTQFSTYLYEFVHKKLAPYITSQDPLYTASWPNWSSVNDARAFIIANNGKASHYSGLCRMGTSAANGVVDKYGKVFGVKSLRVIDTSAAPTVSDGNMGVVGMMMGVRFARAIIAGY